MSIMWVFKCWHLILDKHSHTTHTAKWKLRAGPRFRRSLWIWLQSTQVCEGSLLLEEALCCGWWNPKLKWLGNWGYLLGWIHKSSFGHWVSSYLFPVGADYSKVNSYRIAFFCLPWELGIFFPCRLRWMML